MSLITKSLIIYLLKIIYLRSVLSALSSIPKHFSSDDGTDCQEMLQNTTFDPKSVLDIDWQIFYFWNHRYERSYNIKFSLPSKILVDRFRVELEKEIKPAVNWSEAELFMESSIDFSSLYIRTNVSGLYRLIPSFAFHAERVPMMMFALKIVEPGYLAIMNCIYKLCYALAPVDKMPKDEELEMAASKIGFSNEYGRSYLVKESKTNLSIQPTTDMTDDDEEDVIEVDENAIKI